MSGYNLPVTSPIEDWQAQPHLHDPLYEWIDESTNPPQVGKWAIVLCDAEMAGDGSYFYKHFKLGRFSLNVGICLGFDEEGYASWWQSLDGKNPRAYGRIAHVTHYRYMPELPPEDAPLPACVLAQHPWRAEDENPAYTNQFGRQF